MPSILNIIFIYKFFYRNKQDHSSAVIFQNTLQNAQCPNIEQNAQCPNKVQNEQRPNSQVIHSFNLYNRVKERRACVKKKKKKYLDQPLSHDYYTTYDVLVV